MNAHIAYQFGDRPVRAAIEEAVAPRRRIDRLFHASELIDVDRIEGAPPQ